MRGHGYRLSRACDRPILGAEPESRMARLVEIETGPEDPLDLLHPAVRGWVGAKGWKGLRPIQAEAARTLAGRRGDMIVSAGTASGKTEAAFLPAVSSLLRSPVPGVGILSISPLKSLINDQFGRLSTLGEAVGMPVTRWHGETAYEDKRKLIANPAGIVIITPESLEALLLRRRHQVGKLFAGLRYVVVDELHAFLAGDRGVHVASLLARLDVALGRSPDRIGLSATLGDPKIAAGWLRPGAPGRVAIVEEASAKREIVTLVECVVEANRPEWLDEVQAADAGIATGLEEIAKRLQPRLAKGKNLVFAASRRTVEALADGLRRKSEAARADTAFMPHHGSLAKTFREQVESALRKEGTNATAVATTTLELGIDIGEVGRVVNVGPPRSLAGLRQRVGRSGRREGTVPTLDVEIIARAPAPDAGPLDRLHLDLVCGIAAVSLLHKGFVEPPAETPASLSVLVHQIMALAATESPIDTDRLVTILHGAAPFRPLPKEKVRDLLMRLSTRQCGVLERLGEGFVRLGEVGRSIVDGVDMFSVFTSPVEISIVHAGIVLGQVPVVNGSPIGPGDMVLFQGMRWQVERIDFIERIAEVVPAPKASSMKFDGGEPSPMHDTLLSTMRQVLRSEGVPPWLDDTGRKVLASARSVYRKAGLDRKAFLQTGVDVMLLPFVGTLRLKALALALQGEGLAVYTLPYSIVLEKADVFDLHPILNRIAKDGHKRFERWLDDRGLVPEGKFDHVVDPAYRVRWWADVNDVVRLAIETATLCVKQGEGKR